MVNVGGEKMARSLGNFTTLAAAVDAHGPRALRLLVVQTHYRSNMEMGPENVAASARALATLDALARRARPAGVDRLHLRRGGPGADALGALDAAPADAVHLPAALAAVYEG